MREPRTVIAVETVSLAMSLSVRLDEIPGLGQSGAGANVDQSGFEVALYEYPRRPEDTQKVLDVVAAWVDEIGHPEVTVEFRWPVQQSPKGTSRATRPVFYWKCEEPSDDESLEGRRLDVGPAWIQTQDERGNVTSEPVADGDWITRRDAMAWSIGYTLSLDG